MIVWRRWLKDTKNTHILTLLSLLINMGPRGGLLEGLITTNYRSKIVCLFVWQLVVFRVSRLRNAALRKEKLRLELDLFRGDLFVYIFDLCWKSISVSYINIKTVLLFLGAGGKLFSGKHISVTFKIQGIIQIRWGQLEAIYWSTMTHLSRVFIGQAKFQLELLGD